MMKGKSARKPLSDVSNNNNNNNGAATTSSKSLNLKNKNNKKKNKEMMMMKKESENTNDESLKVEQDNALDHLLLVQSHLSSLLHQVDELVVQAFKLKSVSREGRKEIESFSHILSDMLSSLKPWVPRFQNALSSPSVESESQQQQVLNGRSVSSDDGDESNVDDGLEEATMDSLISPSPLVSWRANCTIQRGRQMFMLTPLPISKTLSSKFQEPSKSEFNKLASSTNGVGTSTIVAFSRDMNDLLDRVVMKPTPAKPASSVATEEANHQEHGLTSSPPLPKRESSVLIMMTPRFKMSPPKSCVLLEPISEIHHHLGNVKAHKSTPFPVGIHYSDSEDSESPRRDASQGLALKYPELLGTHQIPKPGIGKKTIEASSYWLTSPPKTCVLLEPHDEKSVDLEKADNHSCIQITDSVLNQEISKLKDDVSKDHNQTEKSCNQDHVGGNLSHIESTPMWHEPESSFKTGKRPGENTLKKELWTKFEAATTYGFQPKLPTVRKDTQKGFLDLLEEASCDD